MSTDALARYPSLEGMPVVISGGATGIGRATVEAFARQGARVGFVDIARDAGKRLAARLGKDGLTVSFTECDITDVEAYRRAITDFADRHGPALTLVNNAANDQRHDWQEVSPDYWDDRMAVNLKHYFFAIQAVVPGMIAAGRGSIINLGSIAWMILTPRVPVYATAKAAAHGLTRAMARDLGKNGIRVNTIAPGWVMTERQRDNWVDDEGEKLMDAAQALAGRVMPEDVARMALFLASDDSRMISAQEFLVDGGWANN